MFSCSRTLLVDANISFSEVNCNISQDIFYFQSIKIKQNCKLAFADVNFAVILWDLFRVNVKMLISTLRSFPHMGTFSQHFLFSFRYYFVIGNYTDQPRYLSYSLALNVSTFRSWINYLNSVRNSIMKFPLGLIVDHRPIIIDI